MKDDFITKNVWQYSKQLDEETIEFLRGIATDYAKVKEQVYQRYSGVKSVGHLTPVYDILTEMRHTNLRKDLNLPVVYYELAIADAVSDIKTMWVRLKDTIRYKVYLSDALTVDEKHYLYIALKHPSMFVAILNEQPFELSTEAENLDVDKEKLDKRLRRMVRKYRKTPEVRRTDTFRCTPNGFNYEDGGIWFVSRKRRKRVFVPLRDSNTTARQITITIKDEDIAIAMNVDVPVRHHDDYVNTIYMHIGYTDALTLSNGHVYGKSLGGFVTPETYRLYTKNRVRSKYLSSRKKAEEDGDKSKAKNIAENNLGREKYLTAKEKERKRTEDYINESINRMLRAEKPKTIVITKRITKNKTRFANKNLNRKMHRNYESFIRQRLEYKCRLNGIELIEINSKGTGRVCSICECDGTRDALGFYCKNCDTHIPIGLNGARNIEKKAKELLSEK